AYQHHTICNRSGRPVTYLMFKWRGQLAAGEETLATTIVKPEAAANPVSKTPFAAAKLLEGPTAYLYKLHSHLSVLQSRASYAPHTDWHDVAIVVLNGKVQTMERTVEPYGVIFYAAGEVHDMKNLGESPAYYLVFEFHKEERSEDAPLEIIAEQTVAATPARASVRDWIGSLRRLISRPYDTASSHRNQTKVPS